MEVLAIRHLALLEESSLGDSKSDDEGVEVMAMAATSLLESSLSSSSSPEEYSSRAINTYFDGFLVMS